MVEAFNVLNHVNVLVVNNTFGTGGHAAGDLRPADDGRRRPADAGRSSMGILIAERRAPEAFRVHAPVTPESAASP